MLLRLPKLSVLPALLCLCGLSACAGAPPEALNRPSESLLEVVSVLRRHVPDDTYRYAPARDFSGRNVYRASLLRLENLERAFDADLRSGIWDEVLHFSRGRALERLRAYDLAAAAYRSAAEREGELQKEALSSAARCDELDAALKLTKPSGAGAARLPDAAERERALAAFDERSARMERLEQQAAGSHYAFIARIELERAHTERAGLLKDLRHLLPDGDVKALAALQQNAIEHRESKAANAHLLALADFYEELAREYILLHPPESLRFDPARFEELVTSSVRIYESVSNQDGAEEKLEAARRLEALLAFTLKVDRDRFSP